MMGWIIVILLLWALSPFVSLIPSLIAGIIKWVGIIVLCIIDMVKDIFTK